MAAVETVPSKHRSAFKFFHKHAGYQVGFRARGALDLARAESRAERHELRFEWDDDDQPAEACTGRKVRNARGQWEDEYKEYPAVVCTVYDPRTKHPLASLGGIIESNDYRERHDYRRVVEAELAAEVFSTFYSAAWSE